MKGSFTLPLCVKKWRSQLRDVSGRMDGDVSEVLTFQEELRRELFEVVDRLRDEIDRRFKQLHSINEKFGFIQLDVLMNADQIH